MIDVSGSVGFVYNDEISSVGTRSLKLRFPNHVKLELGNQQNIIVTEPPCDAIRVSPLPKPNTIPIKRSMDGVQGLIIANISRLQGTPANATIVA